MALCFCSCPVEKTHDTCLICLLWSYLSFLLFMAKYHWGWLNTSVFMYTLFMHCNKVFVPAFLQAQAVALTVAQAFTVAFELWQVAKEGRHHTLHPPRSGNHTSKKTIPVHGGVVLSPTETVFVLNQLQFSKDIDICFKTSEQVLTCLCYVSVLLACILEKGKRVKSGSAGEASSSSHSERSNSLGSLKGTGERKWWLSHSQVEPPSQGIGIWGPGLNNQLSLSRIAYCVLNSWILSHNQISFKQPSKMWSFKP